MDAELRILIPAHNEATRIEPAVRQYCRYFGDRARITVVCNGCADDTPQVVSRLQTEFANLDVLEIPGRVGKGGAIRAGFIASAEQFVGFVDADAPVSAPEYDRLFQLLRETTSAGVIGSRSLRATVVAQRPPVLRRLASRAFNTLVRVLVRLPYGDTQFGAKIFRRDAIRAVLERLEMADFAFDIDLLSCLRERGLSVEEVPVSWSDNQVGTKIALIPAGIKMSLAALRVALRHSVVAKLPFFDYLARSSVIPVARFHSVLVLADFDSPNGMLQADAILAALRENGHAVERLGTARASLLAKAAHRLRAFIWYVFVSNRRYEAIVEIQSSVPFGLPIFSVKPSFVFEDQRASALTRNIFRLYRRSRQLQAPANGDAGRVLQPLMDALKIKSAYRASFEPREETWVMHFFDEASVRVQQTLRR